MQERDPVRQDVEPELDLLPIDGAVSECVAGDPLLETRELGNGLAGEPSAVVARDPLERVLALHDEAGSVGSRQHQEEAESLQGAATATRPSRPPPPYARAACRTG